MNLDFIPESARAAGLGAMMKGAGKLLRFVPIPQPTLLVGPGSSARLGQAVAGFGHAKILICLLYTSPSPRDRTRSRMPSSA